MLDRDADNATETAAIGARRRRHARSRTRATSATTPRSPTTVARGRTRPRTRHGVVTAAGIFHGPDLQPAHEVSVDDFVHVLRVNLVGTFAVIKHALPMLIDGGGAIVTIASTAAIRGHGYGAGYTASKGGVDALDASCSRCSTARTACASNCICPGGVDTPMTGGTFATPRSARTRASHACRSGATRNPRTSATSRCSC